MEQAFRLGREGERIWKSLQINLEPRGSWISMTLELSIDWRLGVVKRPNSGEQTGNIVRPRAAQSIPNGAGSVHAPPTKARSDSAYDSGRLSPIQFS